MLLKDEFVIDNVFSKKNYYGLLFSDILTKGVPFGNFSVMITPHGFSNFKFKQGILIFDSLPKFDLTLHISSDFYQDKIITIKNNSYFDEFQKLMGTFSEEHKISNPIMLFPKSTYSFSSISTIIRGSLISKDVSLCKISITNTDIVSMIHLNSDSEKENQFVLFVNDASDQLMNFTTSFMNGKTSYEITLNVETFTKQNGTYQPKNSFETKPFQLEEFSTLNVGAISMEGVN